MSSLKTFSARRSPSLFWATILAFVGILLSSGCGSGDSDFAFTGGPGQNPTGSVVVLHPLVGRQVQAKVVKLDDSVTQATFAGKTAQGVIAYGPVTLDLASKHLLVQVPPNVATIDIEYRGEDTQLQATGKAEVTVVAGQTVTVTAQVQKALAIQLVNESEFEDSDVYVLLSANGEIDLDLEGGELATYRIGTGSGDVMSTSLDQLQQVGSKTSSLNGKTCPIYEFLPQRVVSGRLWVSYGGPLTYGKGDSAPGNFEPVRYDKIELGYDPASGNPSGFFDLTAVDFFAIPMQLEVFADPSDGSPLRVTTFYTSTQTLLETLFALDLGSMAASFYRTTGSAPTPGWSPASDTLATFARAMSPSTLVSIPPANTGDPFTAAPYPSFRNYLTTLANNGTVVTLSGANGVDGGALTAWNYQASVVSDGQDGFVVRCQPTASMSNQPQGSLGDTNYPADPSLPKDLEVDMNLTAELLDQFVYGVPANAFTIKNLDAYLSPYAANSVYADIGGNFLAGLNFGYAGGRFGGDGSHWFDLLPGYPPYGAARTDPTDGYYNAYAAVLFNLSDAYSFSISDRLQTGNPLVTTSPDEPYLRVTILPDQRLDAPANVTLTPGPSSDSLNVAWDTVAQPPAGFTLTGYRVIATDGSVPLVSPNTDPVPTSVAFNEVTIDTTATSATLTGLELGTAYRVNVIATGTINGQSVQSAVGQFATLATPLDTTPPTGDLINFVVGLSPPANLASGIEFSVDGQQLSAGTTVPLSRSVPDASGGIVRALFQTTAPDPANPGGPGLVIGQTNILLNVFPDSQTGFFNPYFNFPFSSAVPPSGTAQAHLLDGSLLNFAYNTTGTEPPFANAGNSLSVNVSPVPSDAPKTVAPVSVPSSAPVTVLVPGPTITPPAYTPVAHTPIPSTPFKVQAVLGAGSPTTNIADLKGATVRFVRLVTYPTNGTNGVNVPGADGGGADAAAVLGQDGSATFDPNSSPYSAPIWNLGYRVDVIYQGTTYSAYGAWRTPAVGAEWLSGLTGQNDQPGVISVPITATPQGQVVWGN